MIQHRAFALYAITIASLAGCGNSTNMPQHDTSVQIKTDEYSENVHLTVGQEWKVALEYCASTGYWWKVESFDPKIIEHISSNHAAVPGQENMCGGSSIETNIFRARKPGTTTLIIKKPGRSGENDVAKHVYHITVSK